MADYGLEVFGPNGESYFRMDRATTLVENNMTRVFAANEVYDVLVNGNPTDGTWYWTVLGVTSDSAKIEPLSDRFRITNLMGQSQRIRTGIFRL